MAEGFHHERNDVARDSGAGLLVEGLSYRVNGVAWCVSGGKGK